MASQQHYILKILSNKFLKCSRQVVNIEFNVRTYISLSECSNKLFNKVKLELVQGDVN